MTFDSIDVSPSSDANIYQAVNPVDLPRIDRFSITSGTSNGIYFEGDQTRRIFERYGAAFVDDPDEVGLFAEGIGPASYLYPPIFAAVVNDAILVGYRTILTPQGTFFTDEGYAEPAGFAHHLARISRPDPFANEKTGLRPTGKRQEFHFDAGDRAHRHIGGSALILCSDEPLSYGSFLFRIAPKIKSIRELGLTDLPCIVYAQQKPFMDLLNYSGLPAEQVIFHDLDVVTRIDHAIVLGMRNPHAYLDPGSCEYFEELRASHGSPRTGRKVYVSRLGLNRSGKGASRTLLNEEELIARLTEMGFETIEPETMSVRDQIMAFSSASMIVGPSGSGLFNVMFCHPGTKVVDIQSEPQWIYSYTGMYASLKLEYGIFIGRCDPEDTKLVHRRFTVNIDALCRRILSFSEEACW